VVQRLGKFLRIASPGLNFKMTYHQADRVIRLQCDSRPRAKAHARRDL
jgi:hypothetical protein